jgi:Tol biopolymer transport system component
MAVPFDLGRLEVTGPAVPVVENVMQSIISGALQISFSGTGWLAYVPGGIRGEERDLVWVDRNGKLEPMPVPRGAYLSPRLSPDGRRLAVALAGPNHHLWSYDLTRNTLTRLTFEANNNAPVWTLDGKRLTFGTNWLVESGLVWRSADGSGAEERLTTDELIQSPESWSPDGQVLLFAKRDRGTGLDIWALPIGGERKPRPFLKTTFNEAAPVLSPDGRWLAYASDESGRYEIYLQPYPGPGAKWQISTEGGTEPVWARSGRELFYRNGAKMMSVAITTRPDVTIEKPKLLFEGIYESFMGPRANYDVTPDGQRFVMVQASAEESRPNQIHIVFNWFEDLKRRSPRARGN